MADAERDGLPGLDKKRPTCLILKKVDSQQRVNNVSFTHRETAEVL